MNSQPYSLALQFPASSVNVTKRFDIDADALFWAQLCLDICGKDEHGRRYVFAALFDERGNMLRSWNK